MHSPKIKALDQSGPDVLSGSSRAASSRGQHVSLCSPALLLSYFGLFFVAEFCLRKFMVFSALLGAVGDIVFGVNALVFLFLHKGCLCYPELVCISVAE